MQKESRNCRFSSYLKQSCVLLACLGASQSVWSQDDDDTKRQQDYAIEPRLEVGATFSDNVNLQENDRVSDLVLRASPGINLRGNGRRFEGSLDYSADFLWFLNDGDTDIRHNLFGLANAEVVRDHFFLSGRATIQETFLDREEGFSGNIANRSANRQVVQTYTGEARLQGRFNNVANWSIGYELGLTFSPADDLDNENLSTFFSDSVSHEVTALVDSGDRFSNLRWQLFANARRVSRSIDEAGSFRDDRAGVDLTYKLTREFALVGSAGVSNNDFNIFLLDNDGFFWNSGFLWTPSDRLTLTARAGKDGERTTVSGSFFHRLSKRVNIEASYTDELSTNSLILNDNLDTFNFNNQFGIVDGNGRTLNNIDPSFTLSDVDFRRRFGRVRLEWFRKRTTLFVTGDAEWRTFDNNTGTARTLGGSVGYDRNLDRKTTLRVAASYRRTEFENSARVDNFILGSVSWTRRLSRHINLSVSYNYSDRLSNEAGQDIRENAVSAFIRGTF
ncbi:TIGR03016 family PEP-CTERM system-associated outer membrane protein [Kordiimonas sp. SCSIO 12610]|uniref:TIGR03016 family PEP-CTERM system-associated outer membrane protein n=1 Tax=Kordiimonas sp. SCSIO 12610 TaxID=2829597 RepID=UPI002109AB17|nr:TIGR03016 family PEP-CTERM system-associated outer membrane protein [Kordiimonas sp. SCSIO 12610]UTW54154.1 TIGR03016 family PEP-CTERM system-associated outer membrane protein [Kordiimonas sp. SCSIO 12610]